MRAVIFTAISEEFYAASLFLENAVEEEADGRVFRRGSLKTPGETLSTPIEIILPSPVGAGNVSAAAVAMQYGAYAPDLIAMVGCAGGLAKKAELYDVVFAERVTYYEPAKDDAKKGWVARPDMHKPEKTWLDWAKIEALGEDWKRLIPNPINAPFCARTGGVLAGEKLMNAPKSVLTERARATSDRALAVEMEGFGILEAAYTLGRRGVVVRGISDLMNKDETQDLSETGGVDQMNRKQVAATSHAMAFLSHLLIKRGRFAVTPPTPPLASMTLNIDLPIADLDKVLAALARVRGDLTGGVVNLRIGSLLLDLEVDPVLAVVIDQFARAGALEFLIDLPIQTIDTEPPEDGRLQTVGGLLARLLSGEVGPFRDLMNAIDAFGPDYAPLAETVTLALNAAQVTRAERPGRIQFRTSSQFASVLREKAEARGQSVHGLVVSALERAADRPVDDFRPWLEVNADEDEIQLPFTINLPGPLLAWLDRARSRARETTRVQMLEGVVRTMLDESDFSPP